MESSCFWDQERSEVGPRYRRKRLDWWLYVQKGVCISLIDCIHYFVAYYKRLIWSHQMCTYFWRRVRSLHVQTSHANIRLWSSSHLGWFRYCMQYCRLTTVLFTIVLMMLANSSLSLRILGRISGLKKAVGQATTRQFSTPVVPTILKTGTFIHQLPEIYPSDVYFKKAIKKTREVKIDPTIKNLRNANRKHCAIVLDTLMKALTMPITHVLNIHKNEMKQLHPYEVGMLSIVPCVGHN